MKAFDKHCKLLEECTVTALIPIFVVATSDLFEQFLAWWSGNKTILVIESAVCDVDLDTESVI